VLYVAPREPLLAQEAIDFFARAPADEIGYLRRQDQLEAVAADVPARQVLGLRIENRTRRDNARP
jgi:hypothetical protein